MKMKTIVGAFLILLAVGAVVAGCQSKSGPRGMEPASSPSHQTEGGSGSK